MTTDSASINRYHLKIGTKETLLLFVERRKSIADKFAFFLQQEKC